VGVGLNYAIERMDRLTDAGKGAHVFLPDAAEVGLIFGDYFDKIVEVAADGIAIEMLLPLGVRLESFSGEEVSTDPNRRLQNVVLASGDDLTFLARLQVSRPEAWGEPVTLTVTYRPLATGVAETVRIDFATLQDLVRAPGPLFGRTRIVDDFGRWASYTPGDLDEGRAIRAALEGHGVSDWGLIQIESLLPEGSPPL
jgi:hypothetical protein